MTEVWVNQGYVQRGREALQIYHNYCVFNFSNYKLSFQELIDRVSAMKGGRFFLEGMGQVIALNEMSASKVQDAMESLAKQSQGRIPDNWLAFSNALGDSAAQVNWLEATQYTVVESTKDLAKGAAEVGGVIVDTAKSIGFVAPLAITAALLFVLYRKAKSV